MSELSARLKPNASDVVAALATVGGAALVDQALPGSGPFFGALMGFIIPGLRLDRVVEYVRVLSQHSKAVRSILDIHSESLHSLKGGQEELNAQLVTLANSLTTQQVALFEDGAAASFRSATNENIERIGRIVAHGIDSPDDTQLARQLTLLLGQLMDEDIVVLCSHLERYRHDHEWRAVQEDILPPRWTSSQRDATAREQFEKRRELAQFRIDRLLSLGLLTVRTKSRLKDLPKIATKNRGRIPDVLEVQVEEEGPFLSLTGKLLLQHIGFSDAEPSRLEL